MSAMHTVGWWSGALLDVLFPRSCEGCGVLPGESDGRFVCWECLSGALFVKPPFCAVCGQPVFGAIDQAYRCYACFAEHPFFDRARSCALYEGIVRDLTMKLKYGRAVWLADDLAMLLEACARQELLGEGRPDGVLAVPLHAVKRRERGFNQAALLGRGLARRLGAPFYSGFLKRIRSTSTQTKLTSQQRKDNVQGAFVAKWPRWLEGRSFLLVDDVMTTGATVNECARVLKEAGASRVDVVTLARGVI